MDARLGKEIQNLQGAEFAKEGSKLATSLCQWFHHYLSMQRGQRESSILILGSKWRVLDITAGLGIGTANDAAA